LVNISLKSLMIYALFQASPHRIMSSHLIMLAVGLLDPW